MADVIEIRYDLDVPYAALTLEDVAALMVLTGYWQARNATLRSARLLREAQGPQELR